MLALVPLWPPDDGGGAINAILEVVRETALDPAYLGSVVFPWINTTAAIVSLLIVAFCIHRMRSIPVSAAVAIPSVVMCGIGYGLFAMKIIDQVGLTTIVRPAIPLLLVSVGASCIAEYHRRKPWTTKHSTPSRK